VALQRPEGIEAQLEALIPLVQWRARWALGACPPSPAAALPPVRLYRPRAIIGHEYPDQIPDLTESSLCF
jgi:hypothetical protein